METHFEQEIIIQQKEPKWKAVRWLLFLPGSLIVPIYIQIALTYPLSYVFNFDMPTWVINFKDVITSVFIVYFFILSGSYIVPRAKLVVSKILSALVLLSVVAFTVGYFTNVVVLDYSALYVILLSLVVAIPAFLTSYLINSKRANINELFGMSLSALGYISYAVFGLWSFLLQFMIVDKIAGFWGVVIGVTIFPITFAVTPLYAIIKWGWWLPAIATYGGMLISALLYGIGPIISEQE